MWLATSNSQYATGFCHANERAGNGGCSGGTGWVGDGGGAASQVWEGSQVMNKQKDEADTTTTTHEAPVAEVRQT